MLMQPGSDVDIPEGSLRAADDLALLVAVDQRASVIVVAGEELIRILQRIARLLESAVAVAGTVEPGNQFLLGLVTVRSQILTVVQQIVRPDQTCSPYCLHVVGEGTSPE